MDKTTPPIHSVDDYLVLVPEDRRVALEVVRQRIIDLLPEHEEVISYAIPIIKYKGFLLGFSSSKNHMSLHLMSPKAMKSLKNDLKGFSTTTSTLHFTIEKPIPPELLEKIVKIRMMENEELAMKKNYRKK